MSYSLPKMLQQGQKIAYKIDGRVITEISAGQLDPDWYDLSKLLRYPSLTLDKMQLLVPTFNQNIFIAVDSRQVRVMAYQLELSWTRREGNRIICKSDNKLCEVEYTNINLEKILEEGRNGLVTHQGGIPLFPYPS